MASHARAATDIARTVLDNVTEISAQFANERRERQRRRELPPWGLAFDNIFEGSWDSSD